MDKKSFKYLDLLYPVIALGLVLILCAITAKAIGSELIFPKLSSSFKAFFDLLTQKTFYISVLNTLGRILLSFVISFALALILAILSALFNGVGKVSTILTSIMRAVPTMSIILLALIWLSTLNAPMLVAILVIFPLQFSGILNAIKNVDPRLIEMANIYKVPTKKKILNLYLPETSKDIFSTIRSTISLNVKLIIAAEVMAQTRDSMGLQMQQASMYLEMHVLFAWTIMAIILGLVLEGIILLIQKLCERGGVRW